MRRNVLIGTTAAIAVAIIAALLIACGAHGAVTAARFSAIRSDPTALRAFLQRMPKGADLHVHLSGAVYVEDFIAWADKKGLCYQLPNYKFVECGSGNTLPVSDAVKDTPAGQALFDQIVNAQSLRNYHPSPAAASGHDQFFASFDKYGEISWRVTGEMVATMLRRYAAENVQHTELMLTLTPPEPKLDEELLDKVREAKDTAAKLEALKDYIAAALPKAKENIDKWENTIKSELKCGTPEAEAACGVTHRYIAQINRNSDDAKVFANTAFAAALVRSEPRVTGLNFVGPEDYRIARQDYRKHMEMIGALTGPVDGKAAPVALHAGELWIGLVPPDDLSFHIGDAVRTARARRIGHGVAVAYERRSKELLETMRRQGIAVEINLTSNDVILGVRGNDHPLMTYWAARVPVVLSTDDMGVSRIDLSNEYLRAARDYPLGYRELKKIARNSIEHAFLGAGEKDAQMKKFEQASAEFERAVASERHVLRNMATLIAGLFRWP